MKRLDNRPHIVVGTPGRVKDMIERKVFNLSQRLRSNSGNSYKTSDWGLSINDKLGFNVLFTTDLKMPKKRINCVVL